MVTFGGYIHDGGNSVRQTSDGGFIIAGYTKSMDKDNSELGWNDSDVWLIKTDPEGVKIWDQNFGGKEWDEGKSAQQTSDGGFIITGKTKSFGEGDDDDIWLIKTDSQGNKDWDKTFGGSGYEVGNSVSQTSEGGFIIVGYTSLKAYSGPSGIILIKATSNGDKEWEKVIRRDNYSSSGESVQQTSDGGFIITGHTKSLRKVDGGDICLIKTDSQGTEEWSKTFGGDEYEDGNSVQQTSDGGFIVAGYTRSFGSSAYDAWLIKTDSRGNEEWNKTFGGNKPDKLMSVQQTSDGGFIATGSTESFSNGGSDAWLIKTDSLGKKEWQHNYGGIMDDGGRSVQQTSDGGFVFTGFTNSYTNGEMDVWLIKTDSKGGMVQE